MEVYGKTVIFAKSYGDRMMYSRSISFKDMDGKWHRVYEPVTFKGGDPGIADGSRLYVRKAFESGYAGKDGDKRKLVIVEWEVADEPPVEIRREVKDEMPEEDTASLFAALGEDVPF